ncbi:hypothetical protein C1645_833833 [Glomus cerebriforme]|uniref:Uncharacterized protein n=1 Tax=Glomus cerebriforme TaxID=658196 RepID=A0A397SLI7_9GLOM|nr:hypothetical protein C1645_833833 [Glomus cerebriforme]
MTDNFDNQVENVRSQINVHELFGINNIQNTLIEIKSPRNRNPCKKLDSWILFKKVFEEVCPNYNNIEATIISRVETLMWNAATEHQKSIYTQYSQSHNEEIRNIFPVLIPSNNSVVQSQTSFQRSDDSSYADVLFAGDHSTINATNTTNAQSFDQMYWKGTNWDGTDTP